MTPSLKAKYLYDKFLYMLPETAEISKRDIQRLSLFMVDEKMNTWKDIHNGLVELGLVKGEVEETATFEYWQKVKIEIEKI
jgi:hypothetical protein